MEICPVAYYCYIIWSFIRVYWRLFSAVKDSKIFAISTIVGAIINVILNLVFTPIYGAMGAAVATAVCYFVVWIYRLIQSKNILNLESI